MLIDDVTTRVAAGDGGRGAVAFNKNMMSLGPTGAMGGHGGNVIAVGVSDMSALNQFRFKKEFVAEDGREGRSQFRDGRDGTDLVLKLPIGTIAHNLTTGKDVSIEHVGRKSHSCTRRTRWPRQFLFPLCAQHVAQKIPARASR